MPFYLFKLWRASGRLELLQTFTPPPLMEADSYRLAQARLREVRRKTDPQAGYYVHLVFGEDEADARGRLDASVRDA